MSDVPSVKIPEGLVYLDNNATTACAPEVIAAMAPYWASAFGNAESGHLAGRIARRAVEAARTTVADAFDADPNQIFFTSGATEGNNWIFQAFADSNSTARRVVASAIEHKSVLNAAKRLEAFGFDVCLLPVTGDGVVDLVAAREAIKLGTGLVSVQLANNETGVIQPVSELVELAHSAGAFFHCDAVQALGKMPFSLVDLGVDSAAFSAHKVHGPKGVGFLYLRSGANRFPFPKPLAGGGQERGVRPGTHNVPGIAGLLAGMEYVMDRGLDSIMQADRELLDIAVSELSGAEGLELFTGPETAQSGVLSLRIRDMDCDEAAQFLSERGICLRSGLHCAPLAHRTAGTLETGTLRMSFSPFTSREELKICCGTLRELSVRGH